MLFRSLGVRLPSAPCFTTSGIDTVTSPFRRLGSWALLILLGCAGCVEKPQVPPAPTPSTGGPANSAPAGDPAAGTGSGKQAEAPEGTAARKPRLRRLGETGGGQATAEDLTLQPDDWFEDVTPRTGIQSVYQNGREAERFFILESLEIGRAHV